MKQPEVDLIVGAARDEAGVILKPGESLDWLGMIFELELLWALCGVELVDPDRLVVLAGDEVTSVGEDDLTALTDVDVLVRDEVVVQNVHEDHSVAETHHEVEAGRVKGDAVSFFLELLTDFELEVAVAHV